MSATPDGSEVYSKTVPGSESVTWQSVAKRRRQEINGRIPKEYFVHSRLENGSRVHLTETCGILTERELGIINLSATSLLRKIHCRQYTSVEVTTAYCKSAAVAHQATNCLAWVMFDEALAAAAELDKYIEIHGRPKGPLHGLPISVKEHIHFKDTPASSGLVAWADEYAAKDALVVEIFRTAGAVFHVKTTNPQSLMSLETESNLYGVTSNPHNPGLTAGGSSGGESALLAMRGSPLGIGTDIGGSIRVPAAFCGIYGLKPSVGRLPHGGLAGTHAGMENIIGAVGPMARFAEDLSLFCKVLLDAQPWLDEPSLFEMPWKGVQRVSQRLRIGVMLNDGIVTPSPPITRTLQETVRSLEQAGHEIVTWDVSLHRDLFDTINRLYFLDGGQEYHDVLEAGGEPPCPMIKWILDKPENTMRSVADSWKLNYHRLALQTEYAKQWNASQVDVLLCPANASLASAHRESKYWGYSSVFNLLDYSGVTLPVSTVRDTDTWENFPRHDAGFKSQEDEYHAEIYGKGTDGPKKYKDAPIALQLIGRRFSEEKLLGILDRVMEDLNHGEDGLAGGIKSLL